MRTDSRPHRLRCELGTEPRWNSGPRSRLARSRPALPDRARRHAPPEGPGSSAGSRARRSPALPASRPAARRRAGCPPPPRQCGPSSGRNVAQLLDERLRLCARERLQRRPGCVRPGVSPGGPLLVEVGPRDAEQKQRRFLRERGDVLDQVEQRGSAHWMSSKTTINGRFWASVSKSLRKPQAISSAVDSPAPSAAEMRSTASSSSRTEARSPTWREDLSERRSR